MFLISLLLATLPVQTQDWVKVTEHGFTVEFPATPKPQTMTAKGPDQKDVQITVYRVNSGGRSYLVTISKFSEEVMKQPVETIFDNARNGAIQGSGGKLVSEKAIKIGDLPARDFTVAAGKNSGFVRAQVTVAHHQQYAIMLAAKSQDDLTNADAERFFKAFKITAMKE